MESERQQRIERLCHAALALGEEQRAAFLDSSCQGDAALRREVESLLAYQSRAQGFIEPPARELAARALAGQQQLRDKEGQDELGLLGKTVSHYQIEAKLGSGGMGTVYRATDTNLGRQVALKLLRRELLEDASGIARFQREARALGSLNQPHIAAIYGFEEFDGVRFLCLEYVNFEKQMSRRLIQHLRLDLLSPHGACEGNRLFTTVIIQDMEQDPAPSWWSGDPVASALRGS